MARIDVPTLQCDRCKCTTQDEMEMAKFRQVEWYEGISGDRRFKKDLCPKCWFAFEEFLADRTVIGSDFPKEQDK